MCPVRGSGYKRKKPVLKNQNGLYYFRFTGKFVAYSYVRLFTSTALSPLGVSSTSNSTSSPSSKPWLRARLFTLFLCTKISLLPSLGLMNLNPFSASNHFTVPCCVIVLYWYYYSPNKGYFRRVELS